jgi:nucleotide-binding universal stress UspA family protein
MNAAGLRLLICTNGSPFTQPALEYGAWLSELLNLPAVLLGIVEHPEHRADVERLIGFVEARMKEKRLDYQVRIEGGNSRAVVSMVTKEGNYISVIGPLGRPILRRLVQGRSFRRLMANVETPIVYVPQLCLPLRKVLLCMGGLEYTRGIEHLTIYLCRRAGAEVTILHVVEPVTLDYPTSRQVRENWESILTTDTPQGRNLKQALAEINAAGIKSQFIVRLGNPVHEIKDEFCNGDYDLLALGSPYSTHALRHLYLPNVTAEVAEAIDRPVITARKVFALVNQNSA